MFAFQKRSTASEETDTDKKSSKRKEKDKDGKSRSRKDKPSSDSKEGTLVYFLCYHLPFSETYSLYVYYNHNSPSLSLKGTGSESGSGQNCGISRGRVKHGDKPFPSDSPMAGSILKVLKRNPDGGSAARASTSGNAAEKAESSTKVSETKNAERTDKPARSEKPRYRKPKEGKKDASSAGANNG